MSKQLRLELDDALTVPIRITEDEWRFVAAALETGVDHPLALNGVPILVVQKQAV